MWERIEQEESDETLRKWKHEKTGETVKVEKYKNGTWDTFHEDTLIENYDQSQEAIKRGKKIVNSS